MPVALPLSEWNRIVKWTHKDGEDPEKVKRREYVKYLIAKSKEMAREWPNSLENVNARNEEVRRARIEAAEQANDKFYRQYVRRHREERQRMLHRARDTVFQNKDAPKMLLTTVVQTVVQKERQLQLDFKRERDHELLELKRQSDADILRKAKEWRELGVKRKRLQYTANKEHQRALLAQIKERQDRDRIEHETELKWQQVDNIKAKEHMEAIAEFDKEMVTLSDSADYLNSVSLCHQKAAEKASIKASIERCRREHSAHERELKARETMSDQLQTVLNQSKARIAHRTREINEQITKEREALANRISAGVRGAEDARDAIEQASIANAIKLKQQAEEAAAEEKRQKAELIKRERTEIHLQQLRDAERRKHERETLTKFEIMNRFKNNEIYREFLEQKERERRQKIQDYREEILAQWKETDEANEAARQETLKFYGEQASKARREEDNRVLHYAARLMEECKRDGRPTYALEKGVDRYCRLNNLYPHADLPKSLKKVFPDYKPWDGSKQDPWWKEPPPPPPDLGSDAADEDDPPAAAPGKPDLPDIPAPPGKRDGLQPVEEMPDNVKKTNICLPPINPEGKK